MQGLWFLVATVGVFSIVQSLFGVGLLVFGTPTLLLAGYSFEETIAYLLPSSVLISLMQVLHGRRNINELRNSILIYCIPFIAIGLALVLSDLLIIDIRVLVGVALLLSAITRLDERIRELLARWLRQYRPLYLMAMGFVHGISNMGGGFLTIFVGTVYSDKENTRANIAFGYLVFAISQIAVLLVFQSEALGLRSLGLAALAFAVYQTIGNFIFLKSSRSMYQQLITAFMFAYGMLLIGQELL